MSLQYPFTDDGALIKVPIGRVENDSLTLHGNETVRTIFPGECFTQSSILVDD